MMRRARVALIVAFGGVVLLAGAVRGWFGLQKPWKADKVVLITIDTLRTDRLGCYGYTKRPTSPHLDAWAKEAIVFERTMAQAPWTVPSIGSLLTGRYPVEVGVYTNQGALNPTSVTLVELFRQQGFTTASFNTNPLLLHENRGFRRGFTEVFPDQATIATPNRGKIPFGQTEPSLMRWLEEHARERFFIWIHNMDPHQPPTVGNPYLAQPEWKAYDGEVRWMDESIGRIRAKLTALGIWDEVLLIFTADHGEAFGEHKLSGHQDVMYDEVLQVPLIIQYPVMGKPRRVSEAVELLDVFRTIAELAGLPMPAGTRGESLVPLIEGRRQERESDRLFHARYHFRDRHHELAVRDREWKLLVKTPDQNGHPPEDRSEREHQPPVWNLNAEKTTFELYQVRLDPRETVNRFTDQPEVAQRLRLSLLAWQNAVTASAEPPPRLAPPLDEASREMLRALGYPE